MLTGAPCVSAAAAASGAGAGAAGTAALGRRRRTQSCETFLKIAKKCRRKFISVQLGEPKPFIEEILERMGDIMSDLEHKEIYVFYEALATIVQVRRMLGWAGAAAAAAVQRSLLAVLLGDGAGASMQRQGTTLSHDCLTV